MEPHNIPMVVLGAGLLWFGWFGFNAGSALAVDASAVNAFVVTNTGAAAGILGWTAAAWAVERRPSVIGAASGAVAGLVAVTPAAGFVGPMPALIIGLLAGIFCYLAAELLKKLKLDDSLSVWGVHGVGGTWGALATGLFVGVGFGGIAAFTDRLAPGAGRYPDRVDPGHLGLGVCDDDGDSVGDQADGRGCVSRATTRRRAWIRPSTGRSPTGYSNGCLPGEEGTPCQAENTRR